VSSLHAFLASTLVVPSNPHPSSSQPLKKRGTFCCKKVSSLQRYHTEINLSFLFATLHKTDKMVRPPCCGKFNVKRGLWTADEDAKILAHVAKHGTGNWTAVPKKAG